MSDLKDNKIMINTYKLINLKFRQNSQIHTIISLYNLQN
jgi:hypothetical protein